MDADDTRSDWIRIPDDTWERLEQIAGDMKAAAAERGRYLPEPLPAEVDPGDDEPVPVQVLQDLRSLCAGFRVPPCEFQLVTMEVMGSYRVEEDVVAIDPHRAAMFGLGGADGYYATLAHELLHATGHPRRHARPTCGSYSNDDLEEGTVNLALRHVLRSIGFPEDPIDWHAPYDLGLPVDREAAKRASAWVLQ
jgi:hypothetical protein